MKFKVGDQVIITGGKDKGKKAAILRILPKTGRVIVEGMNIYVKHLKPMAERAGQKLSLPRPLPTAKIAILNNKGEVDRIGYKLLSSGQKVRIYKKTGQEVPEPKKK